MTTHERPFGRCLEDFIVGDVYRHWPGKTITEADNHLFCMITMNHHPLHTNDWFAEQSVQGRNVVVGNLVGLCGSIAAAARFGQAARAYSESSRQFMANSTDADAYEAFVSAKKESQQAFSIASVQAYCEVAMLLLIVASFIVVGVACARRVSATLHGIGAPAAAAASVAAAAGRKLRAQIVFTTAFVFVAFLLRSVYSTM